MSDQADLVGFAPGLRLGLEVRGHVINTADSLEEVKQALRLRYDVLYGECLRRTNPDQIDPDRFDSTCDRLLVIETRTGPVVGTYRLYSSLDDDYYSPGARTFLSLRRQYGRKTSIGRCRPGRDRINEGFRTHDSTTALDVEALTHAGNRFFRTRSRLI